MLAIILGLWGDRNIDFVLCVRGASNSSMEQCSFDHFYDGVLCVIGANIV